MRPTKAETVQRQFQAAAAALAFEKRKFQQAMVDFLTVEIELAKTFLDIVERSQDPQRRARALGDARVGCRTVLNFFSKKQLDSDESAKLFPRFVRLGERLAALGGLPAENDDNGDNGRVGSQPKQTPVSLRQPLRDGRHQRRHRRVLPRLSTDQVIKRAKIFLAECQAVAVKADLMCSRSREMLEEAREWKRTHAALGTFKVQRPSIPL